MLILELPRTSIDATTLTECQRMLARAFMPKQWAASCNGWRAIRGVSSLVRSAGVRLSGSRRAQRATPERQKSWRTCRPAFELFLEFALTAGAIWILQKEPDCPRPVGRRSGEAAAHRPSTRRQRSQRPDSSKSCAPRSRPAGRIWQHANGGEPKDSPESCGWRREIGGLGSTRRVHRMDRRRHIYLDPTAAYRVVQKSGRDSGEVLAVSEQTLRRRTSRKGPVGVDRHSRETLTVRRTIGGSSRSVLHFCEAQSYPEVSDNDPRTRNERPFVRCICRVICREIGATRHELRLAPINNLGCICRECRVFTAEESPENSTRSKPHRRLE